MRAFLLCLVIGFMSAVFVRAENSAAFEAERQKALTEPFANDLGPATLTAEQLAAYTTDLQAAYKNVLLVKCAKCHTAARPLNAQYFEVPGKREEKEANLAALKKSSPNMFTDKNIWQVEPDIWQRYVRRMMSKPGCDIENDEGKAVYRFLVADSVARKSGKNAAAWKAHRQGLLDRFQKEHPARYQELYGAR